MTGDVCDRAPQRVRTRGSKELPQRSVMFDRPFGESGTLREVEAD